MAKLKNRDLAKALGADYSISVDKLVRKLLKIVNDKQLPLSVKEAAEKELRKF